MKVGRNHITAQSKKTERYKINPMSIAMRADIFYFLKVKT